MSGPPPSLGYAPYETLGDRTHVMVDGAPRRATVLTLSHWPSTPTPAPVARDLSVEIVMAYLRYASGRAVASRRERAAVVTMLAAARSAEAVTNDHFDEDGLMSVLAMMEPDFAFEHEDLMVEVASCGDFGVVRSRLAAAASFAIGPLASKEAGIGAGTAERYLAVLARAQDLLAHPERYEDFWGDEMAVFEAGEAAIARGEVTITAAPDDLAIVGRAGGIPGPDRLPGASGGLPVHAVAVHSATAANRVLAFDGPRCELYFRYESWVRYVSRRVPLRPDLAPLARLLTAAEPGDVIWEANPVGAIVGRLRPADETTDLAPDVVVRIVGEYLATAPAVWDPFAGSGALG